jgi:hypothetical protein
MRAIADANDEVRKSRSIYIRVLGTDGVERDCAVLMYGRGEEGKTTGRYVDEVSDEMKTRPRLKRPRPPSNLFLRYCDC